MARYPQCERCPHEHTRRCDTCNPDKPKEPEEITIEKAIEYFEEENERYEGMLGDRVSLLEEYRINLLVIKALKMIDSEALM
jgi:methylphosphotriester-DNA--protein-cysteine methyltransferase